MLRFYGGKKEESVEVVCRRIWIPKALRTGTLWGLSHPGAEFLVLGIREFAAAWRELRDLFDHSLGWEPTCPLPKAAGHFQEG